METFITIILALIALYVIFRIFKAILKWLLIGLIILLAIAFFSNPDESSYLNGFKEFTKDLPVKVKDNALQINNYKLFSIAKVKKDGKEHTIGIGAFGKVWYFEDIKEQFK